MLMFSGCINTEQQPTSPYTVIDSVLGSRTVGDGCVYKTIRHTDGTQSIGVIDTENCTVSLLNEETELSIVEDSFGGIFYVDGFLYRVLNIGNYQEIEQFTADGEYIKELIINNNTEFGLTIVALLLYLMVKNCTLVAKCIITEGMAITQYCLSPPKQ